MAARTVVPEEGPAAVVVGAFAHGAVSSVKVKVVHRHTMAISVAKGQNAFREMRITKAHGHMK